MPNQTDPPPAPADHQETDAPPGRHFRKRTSRFRMGAVITSDMRLTVEGLRNVRHRFQPARLYLDPVLTLATMAATFATLMPVVRMWTAERAVTGFPLQIAGWLWVMVLALTVGEGLAEARGRERAGSLRGLPSEPLTKLPVLPKDRSLDWLYEKKPVSQLAAGEVILVEAGDVIPSDGEVIDGIATVDESPVTGESAPVIRESGGDRSAVFGGTLVLSDWLMVRVTTPPGRGVGDQVITALEQIRHRAALRQLRLTLPVVVVAVVATTMLALSRAIPSDDGDAGALALAILVGLLPTTSSGLLAAVAVAGMDSLLRVNIIVKSGAPIDAAGAVDTLLLDKTGTITFGGRIADAFLPLPDVAERELAEAAVFASLGDGTPEGLSILRLGERLHGITPRSDHVQAVSPFSAEARISGARLVDGHDLCKGAEDAVLRHAGTTETDALKALVERVARSGGTPLVVARDHRMLGVVHLKDSVKPGLCPRFAQLAAMGVRSVMVTGDNPLTAATIAAESGVHDYVARATPGEKVALIKAEQERGHVVAMCGDGANDAAALAQADLGVAMACGTAAAREAGNMIDLDSDPFKLMEVIRIGRNLRRTRTALTGFAVGADVAAFFVLLPPLLSSIPTFRGFNPLRLSSPHGAVLATLIFDVVLVFALIPWVLGRARRDAGRFAVRPVRGVLAFGAMGVAVMLAGITITDALVNTFGFV